MLPHMLPHKSPHMSPVWKHYKNTRLLFIDGSVAANLHQCELGMPQFRHAAIGLKSLNCAVQFRSYILECILADLQWSSSICSFWPHSPSFACLRTFATFSPVYLIYSLPSMRSTIRAVCLSFWTAPQLAQDPDKLLAAVKWRECCSVRLLRNQHPNADHSCTMLTATDQNSKAAKII